jgi:hypothetical protein
MSTGLTRFQIWLIFPIKHNKEKTWHTFKVAAENIIRRNINSLDVMEKSLV